MRLSVFILPLLLVLCHSVKFEAGVYKVDVTLPMGAPLAGYNHGDRRVPYWPLPQLTNYTTFMSPSTGVKDPNWAKALIMDNGVEVFCFVTLDGIGASGDLNFMAYHIAAANGFDVPFENMMFSSSHTHSGPAAISPDFLWAMAPATDLMVPELQRNLAIGMAHAMVQARSSMVPAKMNIDSSLLIGVTKNRRAKISPWVQPGTIDPHLGVIRIDDSTGKPIATVWNFAIHGVCYGPSNMEYSSDIMGYANILIENSIGGVSMFMNGDAGDIDPANGMCDGAPSFKGSGIMADAVLKTRKEMSPPTNDVSMWCHSKQADFGPANLNATLARFDNCTEGGILDMCTVCAVLGCDLNARMPSAWIENKPVFSAFRWQINNKNHVIFSMPGEPLVELGWWTRNITSDLGFDVSMIAGYTNSHLGYFCTPNEYDVGGYESQLTFWGYDTALIVRDHVRDVVSKIAPTALLS